MISPVICAILIALFFYMSLQVVKARHRYKVAYGYGPNNELIGLVSTHQNFSTYMPLFILSLFFVEYLVGPVNTTTHFLTGSIERYVLDGALWVIGFGVCLGRWLHFKGLSSGKEKHGDFRLRKAGMHLTLWPLLIVSFVGAGLSIFFY